jgi:hypothetical protein
MSTRSDLTTLLMARGFGPADATGYVARLTDAQAVTDLAWHRNEQRWLDSGPPSSWPLAQKQAVNAHYLGAPHWVDPVFMLSTYPGERPAEPPAAPASKDSGVAGWVAGGAFLVAVGGLAWWMAQKPRQR